MGNALMGTALCAVGQTYLTALARRRRVGCDGMCKDIGTPKGIGLAVVA